jgi:glycerol uptake facilitator-like aquaporin
MHRSTYSRRIASEALGTAMLLAVVVGSGIMADRLSGGSVGLALLANSIATGGGLIALILALGGIGGAHFNPVVSLLEVARGGLARRELPGYVAAQTAGAVVGVVVAHAMFGEPLVQFSTRARVDAGSLVAEIVATLGLLVVIVGTSASRPSATPFAVGSYITGAYWFTASTSFANPAVTLARAFTRTFAGIRLGDVGPFVGAQLVGCVLAVGLLGWLVPAPEVARAQGEEGR